MKPQPTYIASKKDGHLKDIQIQLIIISFQLGLIFGVQLVKLFLR